MKALNLILRSNTDNVYQSNASSRLSYAVYSSKVKQEAVFSNFSLRQEKAYNEKTLLSSNQSSQSILQSASKTKNLAENIDGYMQNNISRTSVTSQVSDKTNQGHSILSGILNNYFANSNVLNVKHIISAIFFATGMLFMFYLVHFS